MDIRYYERSVLTRVPQIHQQRVLDDLHRHAWQLFSGTQHEPGRPFVFRFDPVHGSRFLVTLRSDKPFPGCEERALGVRDGAVVMVDLAAIPISRRTIHKNGKPCNRERVLDRAEWPDYMQRLIARAGLSETEPPRLTRLARYRIKPAMRVPNPIVNASVKATIVDAETFAAAWLDGVGRSKSYGLGMLRLNPDSPLSDHGVMG